MHNHALTGKPARHSLIRSLIGAARVDSQDRLQSLLHDEGIDVTQATLSRDLRELGVLKGASGYVLESQPSRNGDSAISTEGLRRALAAFAIAVRYGGTTVVVKTGPGQASALALELDRANLHGVLGTVAGDDTVFVATGTAQEAGKLSRELSKLGRGA